MTEKSQYRWLKSTRLQFLGLLTAMVTIGYTFGNVTSSQWIDFLMWSYGLYAASEVGAKGANAYASK
jgi:hypothetical protein